MKDVRLLLLKNPILVGLDITKNLDPSITFFDDILGPELARPILSRNGRLMMTSLANRLIPRRDKMIEAGIEFNETTVAQLCMNTNVQFDEMLKEHVDATK